jgi:protein-tyrosine phosphatase
LLLDFVDERKGQEVADPYFGGEAGFERTWADILSGVQGLAAYLMSPPPRLYTDGEAAFSGRSMAGE